MGKDEFTIGGVGPNTSGAEVKVEKVDETKNFDPIENNSGIQNQTVTTSGVSGLEAIFMNDFGNSELVTQLQLGLDKVYQTNKKSVIKPDVLAFDKDAFKLDEYSAVCLVAVHDGTIYYTPIIIEATGRAPLKAKEIMARVEEAKNTFGGQQQEPAIFVTSHADNDNLKGTIITEIMKIYSVQADDILHTNTIVIPNTIEISETTFRPIAAQALNTLISDVIDVDDDINLADERNNYKLQTVFGSGGKQDAFGAPIRNDFEVQLTKTPIGQQSKLDGLNRPIGEDVIGTVSGFVDAIPTQVQVPGPYGGGNSVLTRLQPHLILTDVGTRIPTYGTLLQLIAASATMARGDMWPAALYNANTGSLNMITNINPDGNGDIGPKLDLMEAGITNDDVLSMIKTMFTDDALISIDVEECSIRSNVTSVLASIARGDAELAKEGARVFIATAHRLTNGIFPKDFPVNEIFINRGVTIPVGNYNDKNGTHDIRDLDLAKACTAGNNLDFAYMYDGSTRPGSVNDSYLNRVALIDATMDATITNVALRLTFTARFITELMTAVQQAGFNLQFDVAAPLQGNTNFQFGGFDSGVINNNNAMFQPTQNNTGGNGFQMHYHMSR
jgi:hypothetical protein